MNYKTQLHGWAVEMIIKAKEAGFDVGETFEDMSANTKKLVEFSYNPEKEFNDCIMGITSFLKTSPDALEKINQLQGELSCIEEDMERQQALRESAGKIVKMEKH